MIPGIVYSWSWTIPQDELEMYQFFAILSIMSVENQDCVGAIDGTHVRASVPPEIQGRFRGRKDGTMQNVLAAISFDLKFIYVLAGWEGSAHDSHVLNDAFARPGGFSIPEGIIGLLHIFGLLV